MILVVVLFAIGVLSQTPLQPVYCDTQCPLPTPPNIDYIGRGYDIFLGAPMANEVDTGFRGSILDSSQVKSGGSTQYQIPAGVEVFDSLACQVSFSSSIVSSASEYSSAVSNHVSADASISGGGYGISASASFSYSKDSQSTASGMANSFKKYVYSSAKCEVYRARIQKYEKFPFSTAFANAVANLPSQMSNAAEKQAYYDLVKNFGTHIITEIKFGSKLTTKTTFTSEAWSTMSSSSTSVSIGASISASADIAGVSIGASAGFGMSNSAQQSAASSFSSSSESKIMYSIGARPPADGNAATWAADAALNPLPVSYTYAALADYYYYDSTGKQTFVIGDSVKRELFRTAVGDYYLNLYNTFNPSSTIDPRFYECTKGQIYSDKKNGINFCVEMLYEKGSKTGSSYNWYSSKDMCKGWGGYLPIIRDKNVNEFVATKFTSNPMWLGASTLQDGTTWKFTDTSPLSFFNWDAAAGSGSCSYMNTPGNTVGKWWKSACNTGDASIVCMRPYIPPTAPVLVTTPTCTDKYTGAHAAATIGTYLDAKLITDMYGKQNCVQMFSHIDKATGNPLIIPTGGTGPASKVPNFFEARKACQNWAPEWDGDLVSYGPDEKFAGDVWGYAYGFLCSASNTNCASGADHPEWKYWIGMTDQQSEGTWKYVDGTYLGGFSWWGVNEPNGGFNENCVQENAVVSNTHRWNDIACESNAWYICEHFM